MVVNHPPIQLFKLLISGHLLGTDDEAPATSLISLESFFLVKCRYIATESDTELIVYGDSRRVQLGELMIDDCSVRK